MIDGVQPRTIEVLKNMAPIGQEMTARGARCYERTFWVTLLFSMKLIEGPSKIW